MTTRPSFVIVGAGRAGAKAAQALREEGFDGRITLIGDEAHRPYERPPLSKDYLQGKSEREKVFVHPQGWYAEHDIDLQMGAAVAAIDRDARQVTLADGRQIPYNKLLLTTGSSPRPLMLRASCCTSWSPPSCSCDCCSSRSVPRTSPRRTG
jgi:3-phenylpropionate/trans-cinnamate dioxygenase ferredoxin reductase subunit